VEEPALPALDEEFCAVFGVTEGGVPKLREDVAANMRRELDQNIRNRNKTAVLEKLYDANPWMCRTRSWSRRSGHADRRHASHGCQRRVTGTAREPFVEPARRRVALGLLINDIIRREKLVLDPARANARLDEMVSSYGDAAALKRAYLQNADAMRQVKAWRSRIRWSTGSWRMPKCRRSLPRSRS